MPEFHCDECGDGVPLQTEFLDGSDSNEPKETPTEKPAEDKD